MKRKKSLKQQLSEVSYHRPELDKRVTGIKKSFGEVSTILNGKNKKS